MPVTPLVVPLAGGKTATLTPATKGFPERMHLKIEGGGSPPFIDARWAHGSPFSRRAVASAANVSESELSQLIARAEPWIAAALEDIAADANPDEFESQPDVRPYGLIQRLLTQKSSEGQTYATGTVEEVVLLLKRRGMVAETVIEWSKDVMDRLVILDLDFHDPTGLKPRPTELELDQLGYDLSPAPWAWWRTHGGGLKALYAVLTHAPFTATELAAGAASQLLSTPSVVRCGGTVELLARTRHPMASHNGKSCGMVHEPGPTDQFACLQRFSAAGATDEEIQDLLETNDMQIGQRLDHSMCVIDPGHVSQSPSPVIVTETGLYCHSCSGRGLGSGFMSWGNIRRKFGLSVTLGDAETAPIMYAVKHLVHFTHVNYLLATLAPEIPERFRPFLYSALLKKEHDKDPRISGVFSAFGYVRGRSNWLYAETLHPVGRNLNAADVSVLPSVRIVDSAGEIILNQIAVSPHTNHGPVTGWTPIQAARFTPIFSVFNTPFAATKAIICKPKIDDEVNRVVYRPMADRYSSDETEQKIAEHFPGVSIPYLKAILVAAGCAESGEGSVPMLWATGSTESAKTTTIRIILEMLGEPYQNLSTVKEERIDQIFGRALEASRLILFDDFAKEPENYAFLHPFLIRINRANHTYHQLHIGETKVPVNSAVLLTDWRTPAFFMNEVQFGRRTHIIHLERLPVSWEKIGHRVEKWWLKTPELTKVAESFFSYVVDEFFPEGDKESFDTKMARLGIFRVVDESGSMDEQRDILRTSVQELILAICKKPQGGLSNMDERRLGRGFREIVWGEGHDIGRLCTTLVDSLGDVHKTAENLHHVLEPFKLEFHKMFPLKGRATVEIKDYGRKTYIRFVQEGAASRHPQKLINEEIFEIWPPPPEGFPKVNGSVNGHTNGHSHPAVAEAPSIVMEPTQDFTRFATPFAEQAEVLEAAKPAPLVQPQVVPQFAALTPQPQRIYFTQG